MIEYSTGKINLEPKEDKQKWYCTLCEDYHTEDKEEYEKMFEKEKEND